MIFQKLLCKEVRLGKPIHSVPDFQIDISICSGLCSKSVFNDDVLGEGYELDVYVFLSQHGCIEIEVLDI